MFGTYEHTLDTKGRLFVPSKLREELGECFYVTFGTENCLSVYTEEGFQILLDKYNALPVSQAGKMRYFFANTAKCEPDKQGRFLLPLKLRKYAQIEQNVTFLGLGGHAEIWATENYNAKEDAEVTPEYLVSVMEELGF